MKVTRTTTTRSVALARPTRLSREGFPAASGLHPELVVRYVQLDLLDATVDGQGRLWFAPGELRQAERIERLRAGLPLNYAALGLVLDLLDRIHELETALRRRPGP